MKRIFLASLVSFAAGAGLAYTMLSDEPSVADFATDSRAAAPATAVTPSVGVSDHAPLDASAPDVAERARVYREVAGADRRELQSMAADALATLDRPGRRFELDAILARLIEIDPDAALTFVRDQGVAPALQHDVGLGVLDRIGTDESTVRAVLDALPGLDRDRFRLAAIQRLAGTDPRQALTLALADQVDTGMAAFALGFGPVARQGMRSLMGVGTVWAERDPAMAIAAIDTIAGRAERDAFSQAVLNTVAQTDPELVLRYLESTGGPDPRRYSAVHTAMMALAARDPQQALMYADRMQGQLAQVGRTAALQQWAQTDPVAALAYIDTLPAGDQRIQALQQIAQAYGRTDPDAALAWARSLPAGQAQAWSGVLAGLAAVDPERAMDLAFDDARLTAPGSRFPAMMNVLAAAASSGLIEHESLAARVLSLENRQTRENALQMAVQMWASSDFDGALNWILNNQQELGAGALADAAQRLVQQNPQAIAAYTTRVLPELRSEWIGAVAQNYARVDMNGASAWLEQFRDDPGYETALGQIIMAGTSVDPAAAATRWQSHDFADSGQRLRLAEMVGGSWASQDWASARNWITSLPRSEARDHALVGAITYRQEIPDSSVLGMFSDNGARDRAVNNVISQIARSDPGRARQMVAEHIRDPAGRAAAERMIVDVESTRIGNTRFTGPGFSVNRGGVGIADAVVVR